MSVASEDFDLFDDALQDDPYPVLDHVREACPVAHSQKNGGHWIVSRYEDMRDVLRDHRTFSSRQPAIGPMAGAGRDDPDPRPALTNVDPPVHSTYRKLLAPYFSFPRIDALREHATRAADDLLDGIGDGRIEFMDAFALPFTCNLFLELMGVPLEDLPAILELRDAMLHPSLFPVDQRVDRVLAAATSLYGYILDVVGDGRRPPAGADVAIGPDVLTVLRSATVDDRPLTDHEVAGIATQVLLAGVDTTATALGNLIARLAADDDLRRTVWSSPDVTAAAVEEILRLEPLIYGARLVTQPHRLADVDVDAGDMVLLLSGAANRDPRHYDEPDAFRLDRPAPADHLAFGFGIHKCLGIHLARMELVTAVDALRRHWDTFEIPDDDAPVRHFATISGIYRLPLRIRRR